MRESIRLTLIAALVPWLFLSAFGWDLYLTGLLPFSVIVTVLASAVAANVGFMVGRSVEE